MPLESAAAQAFVATVPEGKFLALSGADMEKWIQFVADANEPTRHPELFYGSMRTFVIDGFRAGAKPFDGDGDTQWKDVKITPTHVAAALKVQSAAAALDKRVADGRPASGPPADGLAQAIEALAKATKDREQPKKEYLSFNLKNRLGELGLSCLPKDMIPSEESLLRLEKASKVAREQGGRLYIGPAEGDDLQTSFRPSWSRTPKIDVTVGDGTFEEKLRSAMEAKKVRSMEDKTAYLGFATFYGHILDWGVKMVLTNVITAAQLLAYQMVLTRVAEEYGGFRVCTHYDLLLRQKLARALEREENDQIEKLLGDLDRDVLADAKNIAEKRVSEVARAANKVSQSSSSQQSQATPGKGTGKGPAKSKGATHPANVGRQVRSPARRSRSPKGGPASSWSSQKWDNKKWDKKWGTKK
ncbi:unnamed protein product [Prorocentrum cordatum]|uniref:Uncharacterized protein n=1 Tax=Prorocentrum cordatum TaxID=2364126 RepID=A0ABN9VVW1_9DINO|nr:unnamed protein product [Polarella glacialis]